MSVYFAFPLVIRLSSNEFLLNCTAFYSLANLFLAHSTELSDWLVARRGHCNAGYFKAFERSMQGMHLQRTLQYHMGYLGAVAVASLCNKTFEMDGCDTRLTGIYRLFHGARINTGVVS